MADVSLTAPEKKFKVIDQFGKPVNGAVVRLWVYYDKCYRIYPGVGDPCSQVFAVEKDLVTDKNGVVIVPSVNVEKSNFLNTKYKDIEYVLDIDSYTNKELEERYQNCGFSIHEHFQSKALSQNLLDYINQTNSSNYCHYYVDGEDVEVDLEGDILCEMSGSKDGQQITIEQAVDNYKKLCDD